MSTLENLFMQIFDSRTRIIDHQLKTQRQSYDQSLASNLLIHGIRPPSWLWTSAGVGVDAGKADPGELKREELISGLLFPPPRPPSIHSSTGHHAIYGSYDATRDNRKFSVSSAAETCDSNQYFDAVDRLMAGPNTSSNSNKLGHYHISDEVHGVDHLSISHQVQTVVQTSKVPSDAFPSQPIPNISVNENLVGQSKLNGISIVNPVSSSPTHKDTESSKICSKQDQLLAQIPFNGREFTICTDAQISKTKFKQDQSLPKMPLSDSELHWKCTLSGVSQLNTVSTSPQVQINDKLTETFYEPDQSLLRFQRSRSRQKAIEIRNSAKEKTKRHSVRENIATEYTGEAKRLKSSQQPICSMASLGLKNSPDIANEYIDGTKPPGSSGQLCHDDESMNPEQPTNQVGEDEEQKEASGDVALLSSHAGKKAIQSLDGANGFHQKSCTAEIVETESVPGALYATQSICSELKVATANNGVGLKSVLSRPTTDTDTFIEPKKLVFDHLEDCNVKPSVDTPLKEEKLEIALEGRAVSEVATIQSSTEDSLTMDGIYADKLMQCKELSQVNELVEEKEVVVAEKPVSDKVLQKLDIMNGEKEAEEILGPGEEGMKLELLEREEADYSVLHGSPSCKTSALSASSLKKRMPLCTMTVPRDALCSESPTSPGMPTNHAKLAISCLQEDDGKNSLGSQLSAALSFKQRELSSKLVPHQSSGVFSVTMDLQDVNYAHPVVHDTDLSLTGNLVQEKEAQKSDNLIHEKEVQQTREIPNREEQGWETLNKDQGERLQILQSQEAKYDAFHASFSFTPSQSISLEKRMPASNKKVCLGAAADITLARNEMSQISIHDESFSQEDCGKNSQRSGLPNAEDFHLPLAPIDTQTESVADLKCTAELDVAKTLLEGCGVEGAANDAPVTSMSIEFSVNGIKPGTDVKASDVGGSSVAMDLGSSIFKQNITPKDAEILGQRGRYFLRSSKIYSRDLQSSKSNRSHALRKSRRSSIPMHASYETLWPMHRGRQFDCQSDVVNTRRSVAVMQQQQSICKQLKSPVDASKVFQELVEQLDVAMENQTAGKHQSKKCRLTKSELPELHLSSSNLEVDEVDSETKWKDRTELVPLQSKDMHDSGVRRSAVGDSTCCLKDMEKISEPTILLDSEKQSFSSDTREESMMHEFSETSDFAGGTTEKLESILGQHSSFPSSGSSIYEVLQELEGTSGLLRQEGRMVPDSTDKTMEEVRAALGERSLLSSYSARSSYYENVDLFGDDKKMPEAGVSGISMPPANSLTFNCPDLPCSSITEERVTACEQLGKRCSVLTPVDHSTNHRMLALPEVCQSIPNGLLERADLWKARPFSFNDPKCSKDSQEKNEAERCGYSTGRSFSAFIPSSSSESECASKRTPYSPPAGKLCWSSSLEKQGNQNPELTCFRIDEDSCMNEENWHLREATDPFQKRSLRKGNIHNVREALSDVSSKYQNSPQVVSKARKFPNGGSLDTMSMENKLFETQKGGKIGLENSRLNHGTCEIEEKENQNISIDRNGGVTLENHHHRFSRPKLSRKASRKNGSQTSSEKISKAANIVSNISSFLPLVQHKQETATALAGKRDIKVKALEAAEATKRLEEKREKQRQMRKEAAKLERAKLENVRQLKLKKKEEERKKKMEEMAARKRVREEEEKKEKERKRKCIEEARRLQKEREEKLRAEKEEKELRRKADEERKRELAEEARKLQKKEKGKGGAGCIKKMEVEVKPANDVMGNATHESNSLEVPKFCEEPHHIGKVDNNSGNSITSKKDHVSVVGESKVSESYAISPYQGSDNEEEDDTDDVDISQKKFIPLWARGKYLAQSLLSLKHIDPSTIFLRERCSTLSEVLLPRKQKQ